MTPSPARSSGNGLPLILLAIVLALATAVLIIFLTNSSAPAPAQGPLTTVIVANRQLGTGAILSADKNTPPYVKISDSFQTARIPVDMADNAMPYTSIADLARQLDNHIVQSTILPQDFLRKNDPRFITMGSTVPGSLVTHNPQLMSPDDVLYFLKSASVGLGGGQAKEGDHIDLLATICVPDTNRKGGCQMTQTTLQNLLIFATPDAATLVIAVTHQDALTLESLVENAKLTAVIRRPDQTSAIVTQAIDPTWLITHFNFSAN